MTPMPIEQALSDARFAGLKRELAPQASFDSIALCHTEHEIAEIRHRANP